jgi:hypothetical protein
MADKASAKLVISANEQQRIDGLRVAFRDQLRHWMAGVAIGVDYSPAVARALAESLFEMGIIALMKSAGRFPGGIELTDDDERDLEHAEAVFDKVMTFLDAEIAS